MYSEKNTAEIYSALTTGLKKERTTDASRKNLERTYRAERVQPA